MRNSPIRSNIRPKISTMPQQQSEAAAYLDIYKLVVEKKRLQQELESMEQRRGQVSKRLSILEHQIQALEGKAHQLRDAQGETSVSDSPEERRSYPPASDYRHSDHAGQFQTITLDY